MSVISHIVRSVSSAVALRFLHNLVPDLTHYLGEHTTEIETYERSRHRNDNHNVSASASLAWARRSVGSGGVAETQRKKARQNV